MLEFAPCLQKLMNQSWAFKRSMSVEYRAVANLWIIESVIEIAEVQSGFYLASNIQLFPDMF